MRREMSETKDWRRICADCAWCEREYGREEI